MPNIGTTELLIFAPFAMAMFVLPIVALIFLFRDRRPGGRNRRLVPGHRHRHVLGPHRLPRVA